MTYDTYRTGAYEATVNDDVAAVLESPEYADLTLIDVTVEYTDSVPPRQPERVVVTVDYPMGIDPPEVAPAIQERESVSAESAIPSSRDERKYDR